MAAAVSRSHFHLPSVQTQMWSEGHLLTPSWSSAQAEYEVQYGPMPHLPEPKPEKPDVEHPSDSAVAGEHVGPVDSGESKDEDDAPKEEIVNGANLS